MKRHYKLSSQLMALFLCACSATPTVTPIPQLTSTVEPASTVMAVPATPTVSTAASVPSLTQQPTTTPSATTTFVIPTPARVEPTFTPAPNETRVSIEGLPVGEAGHYVNLTFGYWLQYPPTWYTHFGTRPLLVSFSNLDPGTNNRPSMRQHGCLIEVNASVNIYGFSLAEVRAQMPRAFANAESFELDGAPALRVRREEEAFDSEWVFVEHGERLFLITAEYGKGAGELCLTAWESILKNWRWLEPEFAVYRNPSYGYSISAPRKWYRFNIREEGLSISSQDPTLVDVSELPKQGMLVVTNVYENEDLLPLREWVAAQDWAVDWTETIPLEEQMGVRVIGPGPIDGVQRMAGYFIGRLGRIYEVMCLYPESRQWVFRPIANAILYSFSL